MTAPHARPAVVRWSPSAIAAVAAVALVQILLVAAPAALPPGVTERLTVLFVYITLAIMWNALAGYAGLVSVGQQMFFALGAYGAIRLTNSGMPTYPALLISSLGVALVALALSLFMLKLKEGEFAIGMWVLAELIHVLVNLDPLIHGETGTSLISIQSFSPENRREYTYWAALAVMVALGWVMFALLRSRIGSAAQAIRDNEEAASSVGVRIMAAKRVIFVLSALGCALAGSLWLANNISFQPKAYFNVQWSAFMIFMVLVGGIGTYEGPILGAIIFFLMETYFGDRGVSYLIGLGIVAVLFALLLPKGIWGWIEQRWGLRALPIGAWLRRDPAFRTIAPALTRQAPQQPASAPSNQGP